MKLGLACVLFSFIALSVGSSLSESLTYDEVFYLEEGRRIWSTREFRDPYNPPLATLLTAAGGAGRFVTVAFGVLLILAVYRTGGLAAAAILAFEPTFLAHSHYVTSDVAVTLFLFLAAVATNPLFLGLSVGYALSSKMTSLLYLPIVFCKALPCSFARQCLMKVAVALFVALIVLWASYLFAWDVVIRERKDPSRVSARLLQYAKDRNIPAIEQVVTFLEKTPLPLGTYLATAKNNLLRIGRPAMVFFDGALYDRPRWYFMIANVFRKLPIPFLILVAIGAWYRKRFAIIGTAIVGIASIVGMVPLVRFVLPAIPFLAVVAAAGIRKKALVFLLLWQIVSTILHYPHFISYTNELVPRARRFEVLADSNLDWGQALPDIMRFGTQRNIGTMRLSYFGRMSEDEWRFEDICAFKSIVLEPSASETMTAISVSNWYYCGYYTEEAYRKEHIWNIVADTFLVF